MLAPTIGNNGSEECKLLETPKANQTKTEGVILDGTVDENQKELIG